MSWLIEVSSRWHQIFQLENHYTIAEEGAQQDDMIKRASVDGHDTNMMEISVNFMYSSEESLDRVKRWGDILICENVFFFSSGSRNS